MPQNPQLVSDVFIFGVRLATFSVGKWVENCTLEVGKIPAESSIKVGPYSP